MQTLTTTARRPRLPAAAVLALAYVTATGLAQPQPAAAAAKFSQPITNVVWETGTPHSIIWTDATPGRHPLKLMRGQATALQQVAQIAVVDGAAGHYEWAVPADLPSDNTYAIALGNSPDIGFTGQFTIRNTHAAHAPIPTSALAPAPAPAPARP
ncbi:GPI anchored serine-threonine rich family protein [Kitasatospora azatica]|uniref:GPI anchored serine-threonine rich family protein n=1 Tax=Kitasatospora azatica TaxID=58347 RepID=UPI00056C1FFF|nr:GPI anchored serine-threonine rich family protein [Kitasatospora azatica]